MDQTRFDARDSSDEDETAGQDIRKRIRQQPGRLKQTRIAICGYEMHQQELLDRTLIAVQNTEHAFVDINNRIISNVNNRKERLNALNARIASLAQRTMKLFNCTDPMRVESPATFPKISTAKERTMHPHQSIFYETQVDLDEEANRDPAKKRLEEMQLPELSSRQLDKKLFNSRLCNDFDNLGNLVKGITKDIVEVSQLTLNMKKYGMNVHNVAKDIREVAAAEESIKKNAGKLAQNAKVQQPDAAPLESEGILGRMPDDVESIAELMLQDTDVNVYQEQKVVLKEEAFTIRGKKQRTQAQKEQLIRERKQQALQQYRRLVAKQKKTLAEEDNIKLLKPTSNEVIYRDRVNEIAYKPAFKPAAPLLTADGLAGLQGVTDFDSYNQRVQIQKQQATMMTSQLQQEATTDQIDTTGTAQPSEATEHLPDFNAENEESRMSEMEGFAPARGVAEMQAEYKRQLEEAERLREEHIERLRQEEEAGISESRTGLPIDYLIRQKMERQVRDAMVAANGRAAGQSGAHGLSLATTQDATAQNLQPGAAAPQQARAAPAGGAAAPKAAAASNVPQAPAVALFYEFVGGKAPAGAAGAPAGGNDMENLLGAADEDLEFNPDDVQFNSSRMIEDLGASVAPAPKPAARKMPGDEGFVEWTAGELGQVPLAEQLQYQRKLNEWKKAGGAAASAGGPPKEEKKADGDGGFKELTTAELGALPLAEQLQYQKKFNEWKKSQQAAKDAAKPPAEPEFKELTVAELGRLPLNEQLAYQRKLNEKKAKERKEKEAAAAGGGDKPAETAKPQEPKKEAPAAAAQKPADDFKELSAAELAALPLAEQLQYQRKLNEHKKAQQAAAAPAKPAEKPAFKELTVEELGRLPMPAQLKYQRELNEHKAALRAAAAPPKPAPPAPAEEKKLSESVRSNETSMLQPDQSMLSNAPLAPIAEESERGTVIEAASKELAQSAVTPAADEKKPVFQLSQANKSKTIRPAPAIREQRRESHMDALKSKLLERYALMNKAPTKEESSENESSDASDDSD